MTLDSQQRRKPGITNKIDDHNSESIGWIRGVHGSIFHRCRDFVSCYFYLLTSSLEMMVELTASPRYWLSFLFEASYLSSLSFVCSSSLIRLLLFPPARFFYRPYRPASYKVSFDMVIEDAIAVGK